jgi:hypothetical protein
MLGAARRDPEKLERSHRLRTCPACGTPRDRDVGAARDWTGRAGSPPATARGAARAGPRRTPRTGPAATRQGLSGGGRSRSGEHGPRQIGCRRDRPARAPGNAGPGAGPARDDWGRPIPTWRRSGPLSGARRGIHRPGPRGRPGGDPGRSRRPWRGGSSAGGLCSGTGAHRPGGRWRFEEAWHDRPTASDRVSGISDQGPDATTYLSGGCHNLPITDICTTADLDRLNEQRYKVALIETVFLREVAMSQRACRLNVAVRSSRLSDAACPNTRSPATSASLSRRSATGSSGHGDSDWTASTGTINRRSPAPRNAHRPTSRT